VIITLTLPLNYYYLKFRVSVIKPREDLTCHSMLSHIYIFKVFATLNENSELLISIKSLGEYKFVKSMLICYDKFIVFT
jgi:hypothetical protein